MAEVVLVTGGETLMGRKLIEKKLFSGATVIAPIAGSDTDKKESGNPKLNVFSWNRASWFSTKNIVRKALNLHGKVDSAFLLHQLPSPLIPFEEANSSDVEDLLEQSLKANIALIREIKPILEKSHGFLGLVIPHRLGEKEDPLCALTMGAFVNFSTAFMQQSLPNLWCCGFYSTTPNADGFTEVLLRYAEERSKKLQGHWLRYAEGRRLFGSLRIVDTIR